MRISDWSSDVCSSDLCSMTIFLTRSSMLLMGVRSSRESVQTDSVREYRGIGECPGKAFWVSNLDALFAVSSRLGLRLGLRHVHAAVDVQGFAGDRKSTRLNSSH